MEAGTAQPGPAARSALWLPLFDELSDPTVCARLAAEAEEAGWHGFFVWDQLRWEAPVRRVADSWITLAAIVAATERLRLGPMVTPLPRRRPVKVARETATLDQLSGGRLTLGVGIGEDRFAREFSKTGEQLNDRARGQMLDEALEILTTAWSGEPVHHHGDHYTVDDIQFLPRPVQRPGVPVWIAGFPGNTRPMRRAARYDGFFPSTSSIPTSSPRSSPRSQRSDRIRRQRTTSSSVTRWASIRTRGSRRVPRGASRSSNRGGCRRTRSATCFAMAPRPVEHPDPEPSSSGPSASSSRQVRQPVRNTSSTCDAQTTKERFVTARQLTFKRIQDTTADDWAIIATRPNTKLFEELPDRLLGALRFLENGDFYTVNGLEHSLQAGTRALRHGRPAEYVVAALLHDVGDLVGPRNHAAVAASILRPYVSERIVWIVEHHTVFQFNHFGRHIGIDPDMRDAYLGHPYYEDAAEFSDLYDSESFDPSYESLPLEEFEPLLRQVFVSSERSPFELANSDL